MYGKVKHEHIIHKCKLNINLGKNRVLENRKKIWYNVKYNKNTLS